MWDVFISYAWEDKPFARSLAIALIRRGFSVWFDDFTLTLGDSLLRSIDHGLANSRYGVVILSPNFFAKEWPQKELDGFAAREVHSEKVILPVWHNVTAGQVREYSPILAGRLAVSSELGLGHVVRELRRVIKPSPHQVPSHDTMPEAVSPIEPEMILIPAGEFLMGSDPRKDKDTEDDEQPQHTLYLPNYYLAKTPVTNAKYRRFVGATGHRQPKHWKGGNSPDGEEDHPVVYVSWHDAIAYCNWLTEITGRSYYLPSEAEWEKGARGTDGRIYPWGNQWDAKRCNAGEGSKGDTTAVWAYPEGASPYGLLDMAGNVVEWTRSVKKKYPYNPEDGREDVGTRGLHVLRGGSFDPFERTVRCAARVGYDSYILDWDFGFRVMMASGFLLAERVFPFEEEAQPPSVESSKRSYRVVSDSVTDPVLKAIHVTTKNAK